MNDFNDYQKKALTTAKSKGDELKDIMHWVLGVNGEAGEIAEKVKKIIRDKDGVFSAEDKQQIAGEIGDVLWYLAVLSHQLGIDFEQVAANNLKKLSDRKNRGVIGDSGDHR